MESLPLFLLVHLIDGIFLCISFSVEISASFSVGYQQTIGEEFDIGKLWCKMHQQVGFPKLEKERNSY